MSVDLLDPLVTGPSAPDELARIRQWREALREEQYAHAHRTPLDLVTGWDTGADLPAYRHHSSKFFSIVGIEVNPAGGEPPWMQPVVDQPEVGLLGIAITRTDRGYAALIQAKAEPGNVNGIQLSPTVQATESNSLRVHGGRAVPYLELFSEAGNVVVDTRQSEHGEVFWRKRNRVMVVEIEAIEPTHGFRWVELADLLSLLQDDDLVHADTRAVLACIPWTIAVEHVRGRGHERLFNSLAPTGLEMSMRPLARWMSAERTSRPLKVVTDVPLPQLRGWRRSADSLTRVDCQGFEIVAVDVEARGREVDRWAQPMVHPHGVGLTGLAVAEQDDQLMVLLRMCPEPGLVDGAELGPTVQLPGAMVPRAGDEADLTALLTSRSAEETLFDSVLSDEGGRFLHGRHRHLIVTVERFEAPPGYRWCRLAELTELLIHSHQVNMQARSIYVCLLSLLSRTPKDGNA
jgi:oxidase EvaA